MSIRSLPDFLRDQIHQLGERLDRRVRPRFWSVFFGLPLCREKRRTASAWFRAAGIGDDFHQAYETIGSVGRRVSSLAVRLLGVVERSSATAGGERLVFALDDTPTKRYGPEVQGAGVHHNPTPGPAGQKYVYGHVWVTLARVVKQACWGTIALPVRAELCVREKDLSAIPAEYGWTFRTKLEQAVGLIGWLLIWLAATGKPIWLLMDGAYAKRPVLRAAKQAGVFVVSRLRHDAALRTVPDPARRPKNKRGRKPVYGDHRISLAKRAASRGGWTTEEVEVCGRWEKKTFKTFLGAGRGRDPGGSGETGAERVGGLLHHQHGGDGVRDLGFGVGPGGDRTGVS